MTTATAYLSLMGADFVAEIDLTVRSWATPATHGAPAWFPDFEIEAITLREERLTDDPFPMTYVGPPFEATGALFKVLAASRAVDEAILSTLENESETDDLFAADLDDYDYSDR